MDWHLSPNRGLQPGAVRPPASSLDWTTRRINSIREEQRKRSDNLLRLTNHMHLLVAWGRLQCNAATSSGASRRKASAVLSGKVEELERSRKELQGTVEKLTASLSRSTAAEKEHYRAWQAAEEREVASTAKYKDVLWQLTQSGLQVQRAMEKYESAAAAVGRLQVELARAKVEQQGVEELQKELVETRAALADAKRVSQERAVHTEQVEALQASLAEKKAALEAKELMHARVEGLLKSQLETALESAAANEAKWTVGKEQVRELREEVQRAKDQCRHLEEALAGLRETRETAVVEERKATVLAEERQALIVELQECLRESQKQTDMARRRVEEVMAEGDADRDRVREFARKVSQHEERTHSLEMQLGELRQEKCRLGGELERVERRVADYRREAERAKDQANAATAQSEKMAHQLHIVKEKVGEVEGERDELLGKVRSLSDEVQLIPELKNALAAARREAEESQGKLSSSLQQEKILRRQLSTAEETAKALEEEIRELNEQLASAKTKITQLTKETGELKLKLEESTGIAKAAKEEARASAVKLERALKEADEAREAARKTEREQKATAADYETARREAKEAAHQMRMKAEEVERLQKEINRLVQLLSDV